MEALTPIFQQATPDIEPIDFEGVHLILEDNLAWFYRFFRTNDCEEAARRELYPWLKEAKRKSGVLTPENTAHTPEKGH